MKDNEYPVQINLIDKTDEDNEYYNLVQKQFKLIDKNDPQYKPAFLFQGKEIIGNLYMNDQLFFSQVPIIIDSEYRLGFFFFKYYDDYKENYDLKENNDLEEIAEEDFEEIEIGLAIHFLKGDIYIKNNSLFQENIQIEFETPEIAINIYKLLMAYEITHFNNEEESFTTLFKEQTGKNYYDVPLQITLNSTYYINYLPDPKFS